MYNLLDLDVFNIVAPSSAKAKFRGPLSRSLYQKFKLIPKSQYTYFNLQSFFYHLLSHLAELLYFF